MSGGGDDETWQELLASIPQRGLAETKAADARHAELSTQTTCYLIEKGWDEIIATLCSFHCTHIAPFDPQSYGRFVTEGKRHELDATVKILTRTLRRPGPVSVEDKAAETEKRLIGALLAASPIISIDNINREFVSDILCQAGERPRIQLRPLGYSSMVEIENRCCFVGTGNGLCASGDLLRRTLTCRLDPKMERPETRHFDANPVARDRVRFVKAALTIVRAFLVSGEKLDLLPIASFEGWSSNVRGAIVWLGCADPALSIVTNREDDGALRMLLCIVGFLNQLFGGAPFSIRDIIAVIGRNDGENDGGKLFGEASVLPLRDREEFREQLLCVAGARGVVNGRRLSTWLTRNSGRRSSGSLNAGTCQSLPARFCSGRIVAPRRRR